MNNTATAGGFIYMEDTGSCACYNCTAVHNKFCRGTAHGVGARMRARGRGGEGRGEGARPDASPRSHGKRARAQQTQCSPRLCCRAGPLCSALQGAVFFIASGLHCAFFLPLPSSSLPPLVHTSCALMIPESGSAKTLKNIAHE